MSDDELSRESVEYGPPERQADGRIVVRLGVPDSDAVYAGYAFTLSGGQWLWSSEDTYIEHDPDDPLPPPPCGASGTPDGPRPSRSAT